MNVFVTGAAGYIGGSVAARLQERGHRITALVRRPEAARALSARGFTIVQGSLDDRGLVAEAARAADAIVNAADSDHRGVVETILEAAPGKRFLHTSGSSIVADDARGGPSDAVYDEETPNTPVPEKAARVAIDDLVRKGGGIVVCPTMIYGRGPGLTPHSDQVPKLIREAKRAGVGRRIGAGQNVWSHVHVDDLVDLYERVFDRAPGGAFYFAENGEASLDAIARAVGRTFGLGDRAEEWPLAEAIAALGDGTARFGLASNSRVRAVRARRELGWAPSGRGLLDEIAQGSYARDFQEP